MSCEAILSSGLMAGARCGNRVKYTQGNRQLCGIHHSVYMKSDNVYKTTYETAMNQLQMAQMPQQEILRETQYTQFIAKLETPCIELLNDIARKSMEYWHFQKIPGWYLPRSYVVLKNQNFTKPEYILLYKKVGEFVAKIERYTYRNISEAEKTTYTNEIQTLLQPYGDIDLRIVSPIMFREYIRQRQLEEENERRRRLEEEREREFQRRLREEAVVFRRDPEGSIDLQAFATDPQNIHRSSVQNATQRAVQILIQRPVPADSNALNGIYNALYNENLVTFNPPMMKDRAYGELTKDYLQTQAFNIPYSQVIESVWVYINTHKSRKHLLVRLAQEILEGIGMCSNGKMARLVNVLQGFDETLYDVPNPQMMRELFQNKIAKLMENPLAERENLARQLFQEYQIPEEEHNVWLEPLLEV